MWFNLSKPGLQSRVLCGVVCVLLIANGTFTNWSIYPVNVILFYFEMCVFFVFYYITIIHALVVLPHYNVCYYNNNFVSSSSIIIHLVYGIPLCLGIIFFLQALPPQTQWQCHMTMFIMQHSCFDNTLYFHITLTPNGVIVLWSAFI